MTKRRLRKKLWSIDANLIKVRLHGIQCQFVCVCLCVTGTVYYQQQRAFLVISGMCVFSVASGLFVFPAIEPYYTPAIRVYRYEREDGVGRSGDLVIQGFVRYITLAFLPVILSSTLVYLLVSLWIHFLFKEACGFPKLQTFIQFLVITRRSN